MSAGIYYDNKFLGNIHFNLKGKNVLQMENLDSLETLFRLTVGDKINIDEQSMNYRDFRKEILEKTTHLYTSAEDYVINEFPIPFGTRATEEMIEAAGLDKV